MDALTIDDFLKITGGDVPVVLKCSPLSSEVPRVIAKWFELQGDQQHTCASRYLSGFGHTLVNYECTVTPSLNRFFSSLDPGDLRESIANQVACNEAPDTPSPFLRFRAPLDLFIAALSYNKLQSAPDKKVTGLYIAQSSLSGLPESLQQDLAPPPLVKDSDIYSSSIWLGLTPTYTPLHRDPNPNLFRQLHGSKIVRTLPPRAGHTVFTRVQAAISTGAVNSRLRGEEMMEGPEKSALHDAIWTDHGDPRVGERTIYEVTLEAGDAMYLPTGWWHSLKSAAAGGESGLGEGELNCSVNWWFRSSALK